jgi:hypothetical protein
VESRQWALGSRQRTVSSKHWAVDSGQWAANIWQWTVDSEQQTLGSGHWTVSSKHWTVDSRQRAMGTNRMEPSGILSVRYRNFILWNFDSVKFDILKQNFAKLSTVCFTLFTVHCPLPSVHYPLFIVLCLLPTAYYPWPTVYCPTVYCLSAAFKESMSTTCKSKLFFTSIRLVWKVDRSKDAADIEHAQWTAGSGQWGVGRGEWAVDSEQ